ncbi:MAG: PAS-domain containing protein [Paracoccaceae bacterium]
MTHDIARRLLNPADPPVRQVDKLMTIVEALMRRVEQDTDHSGAAYAQFERAALLEDQVRTRTRELEDALDLLHTSNSRLEAANREAVAARRNLSDAIETIQEGFALFDAADCLVMCNSRFGIPLGDVRPWLRPGLSFAEYVDAVSHASALYLPDGMSPSDWAVSRLARHGERSAVFTVRLQDDCWLQVSEHRTRDGGTVILQTDVTDIIRAEREARGRLLDDQARIVRATLDHIHQGVCIFDDQARLVGWNERAAELLAISRARFRTGSAFSDLVARLAERLTTVEGTRVARLLDWVERESPRPPLRFEIRRDGDVVLDAFAQEMPDGGFVISFADITAERRAIDALSRANETLEAHVAARTLELRDALAHAERANASRSRFVAAASHDLLQPLSAAKLFLASMADEALSPRAVSALDKSMSALQSVEAILDALLDISRLESGKLAVNRTVTPLNPLFTRLHEEFAPMAAEKGLSLRFVPTDAAAETDPTWLRRILQNLVSNALRYTQAGGVLVCLRRGSGGLRIEVVDTGPGIPEHERDAIFREFHRLNARASAAEGLGLGLAIVERACALLGHAVTLNTRMGFGSRFVVHLGAEADAPAPAAPPVPTARPELRTDLIGLLVARDPEMRPALSHLLEGWGVNVLDAADARDALDLMDEIGIAPDFVLIDARAEDEEASLSLVQALVQRFGPLRARILSANRSEAWRLRAARAGAPLLYKPLDARLLERFVAQAGR